MDTLTTFGERLKWARNEQRLKVIEAIIPEMKAAGFSLSASRWYEWEKIGTDNDPRRRKTRKKTKVAIQKAMAEKHGITYSEKREVTYNPPWPDELAAIEILFGIRAEWLLSGQGSPFTTLQATKDSNLARLQEIFEALTQGQQSALLQLLESFDPSDRQP